MVVSAFTDLETPLARLGAALFAARGAVDGACDFAVSHRTLSANRGSTVPTLVATILLRATRIVSLFGVNLGSSFRGLPAEPPRGFALMLGCIALVTTARLWTFRRRDWR